MDPWLPVGKRRVFVLEFFHCPCVAQLCWLPRGSVGPTEIPGSFQHAAGIEAALKQHTSKHVLCWYHIWVGFSVLARLWLLENSNQAVLAGGPRRVGLGCEGVIG